MSKIFAEGEYECTLMDVAKETYVSKPVDFIRLTFRTHKEVAVDWRDGDDIFTAIENARFCVNLPGSWQHFLGWKRLYNQSFKVRIKHRKDPQLNVYLHGEILE